MDEEKRKLTFIIDRLGQPPFNRTVSVIQLHDDWTFFQLLQLINDILVSIDFAGNSAVTGNAPFVSKHKVDLRDETADQTVTRLVEFLSLLKYKTDYDALPGLLLDGKKDCVFEILFYLLGNLDICAKRAYLAPFLSAPNVPPEFLMDSDLSALAQDLGQLQANFVQSHRMFEDLKAANEPIIELKKDLSKMEEEKQQVLIKIARMKKKVEDIPNNELWLEAARNLRLSKKNQADLAARLQEQIRIIEQDDAKIVALHEKMNTARVQNKGLTPQAALTRAGEELNTIRYLVQEKYPKDLDGKKSHIKIMQSVLSAGSTGAISGESLKGLEKQIAAVQEELSKIPASSVLDQNPLEDRSVLFRQQATIISNKKESKANELVALTQKYQELSAAYAKEKTFYDTARLMNAEEFKKFVGELRNKSTDYKNKKGELGYLQRELGILQRSDEIVSGKLMEAQQKVAEQRRNISDIVGGVGMDKSEIVNEIRN